jgi:stage II sporulation protein M
LGWNRGGTKLIFATPTCPIMPEPMLPERALKPYLLILSLLFAASLLTGAVVAPLAKTAAEEITKAIREALGDLPGGALFYNILVHDMIAAFLIIILGVSFGIIPVPSIGGNGFVLGVVFRLAADTMGYAEAAARILPHGLLEIPALLIAASYGLWLGANVLQRIRGKETEPVGAQMKHALKRYVIVVVPLLVVAAGIETVLILVQ